MLNFPGELSFLQPDTSAAYQRTIDTVLPFTDERLLALCREQLRAAQQRMIAEPPTDCSEYERGALRLADQFAVNVDGISEGDVAVLGQEAGEESVNALVNAIYLLDMTLRLEAVVPVVLSGAGDGAAQQTGSEASVSDATAEPQSEHDGEGAGAIIAAAIAEFAATAVLADGVDAITSELVRLRCAQIHHCRLCGSLRQQGALDEGFDEAMASRIARYEEGGFSEAAVVALRLVDTIIMFPADASPALKAELDRHYAPAQIAELCFDVVKWSQQKALVATHIDAPPWEGIHILDFDVQGHPVFSGPLQESA